MLVFYFKTQFAEFIFWMRRNFWMSRNFLGGPDRTINKDRTIDASKQTYRLSFLFDIRPKENVPNSV